MNTILTDDEIAEVFKSLLGYFMAPTFDDKKFARAVEAAVLAKLAQQAPVAWMCSDPGLSLKGYSRFSTRCEGAWNIPVYTHPAPQQAAPAGWKLVPEKLNQAMAYAAKAVDGRLSVWKYADVYRAMLAAAPEAPAQADRQRVLDEPDWRHPKIQALIGSDARNRICIDLVWRILEDPRREFTASDMEYWDKLHDKVQEVALAAAPEAPEQREPRFTIDQIHQALLDHGLISDTEREDILASLGPAPEAPAQVSAVDERAAFEAWVTNRGVALQYEGDGFYGNATVSRWWEAWQARAALAQKGGAA